VISQLDRRYQIEPVKSAESAERSACNVGGPRSSVQQSTDRQVAGDVEQMVVSVAEATRQLH